MSSSCGQLTHFNRIVKVGVLTKVSDDPRGDELCRCQAKQCFSSKVGSGCYRLRGSGGGRGGWRRSGRAQDRRRKRLEKSGETMEGFRAVAGVWLLLFVSGQLLEVSSRVRVLFDLCFESVPLTTILAIKGRGRCGSQGHEETIAMVLEKDSHGLGPLKAG